MQLRLPIAIGVVALAAGAALLRGHGTASSFAIASNPGAAAPAPADVGTANVVAGRSTDDPYPPNGSRSPMPNGFDSTRRLRGARVSERSGATIVVYVAGEVVRAGLYTLPLQSRAADAVRAAGGARPDADLVGINLAAPLADGDEVAVAVLGADGLTTATSAKKTRGRRHRASVGSDVIGSESGDVAPPKRHRKKRRRRHRRAEASAAETSTASDTTTAAGDTAYAAGDPASDGRNDGAGTSNSSAAALSDGSTDIIDLNRADASELETLPGIGPTLADRIVTFRELNGPFASSDDLLDVGGMTQGKLDALLPYVIVR